MVRVCVKWNKHVYEDVELDPSLGVEMFKSQLFSLTGVPVDRQKLMAKGAWKGVLKDDEDLSVVPEGQQVMLMGTADVVRAPETKTEFIEDMTSEEQAKVGATLPGGLKNLGNTCYMNSTLQCIRHIPELREALAGFRGTISGDLSSTFTAALTETYNQLDRSTTSITPLAFVTTMRQIFPQFAQRSTRTGNFMQQDAEELYNSLMSTLAQNLRHSPFPGVNNVIDGLFEIIFEEKWNCAETQDEPMIMRTDRARKLVCNIQGGPGSAIQINHLHEGLRLGLEGTVEKRSDVLGRDALWNKTSRISRLPRYLCVQFMRFFWKPTPNSRDHTGIKTKIVRPVSFPETFDVFEFCSETLQQALKRNRDKHDKLRAVEEEAKSEKRQRLDGEAEAKETTITATSVDAAPMEGVESTQVEMDEDLRAAMQMSMQGLESMQEVESKGVEADATVNETESVPFGPGIPSEFTGMYELFAVVTHKGRSADSGHYMGWARQAGDQWVVFDDDEVSECTTENVMDLKGGGDYHMAYLIFYRFKMQELK